MINPGLRASIQSLPRYKGRERLDLTDPIKEPFWNSYSEVVGSSIVRTGANGRDNNSRARRARPASGIPLDWRCATHRGRH